MDPTTSSQEPRASILPSADTRFRKLIQSGLVGIGCGDKNGVFTFANDRLLALIGYTRADLTHGWLRWDILTPGEYHDLDKANMAQAVRRGHCVPYEKELLNKNGERVPVLIGYTWTGEPEQQFIGFILDLTAQKQAEAESRTREEQFKTLAESLPQLIFTCDANGVKTYCCPRYLSYTGASSREELTTTWLNFIHPNDRKSTSHAWMQALTQGEAYTAEYRMRRHDGEYRHQVARAEPLRNLKGEITSWVGAITDIDDQKKTEEVLRRTEKLAAAARIAASLAHEINNPLASVTNSLYLAMQDPNLSPTTRSYLRLADQELARVAQVTTQNLRFHAQSTSPASVDIGELMDISLSTYTRRFEAYGIRVDHDYEPGYRLFCRGDDMRQVFVHLLSNAIDAMPAGGRLKIRIRKANGWDRPDTPGVRVTVADTGKGIAADFLPRVFEPFTSTKFPTGTGLGLWVVEGVVRKHDGRIAIRSTTGDRHGTVVSIFFPYLGVTDITA